MWAGPARNGKGEADAMLMVKTFPNRAIRWSQLLALRLRDSSIVSLETGLSYFPRQQPQRQQIDSHQ